MILPPQPEEYYADYYDGEEYEEPAEAATERGAGQPAEGSRAGGAPGAACEASCDLRVEWVCDAQGSRLAPSACAAECKGYTPAEFSAANCAQEHRDNVLCGCTPQPTDQPVCNSKVPRRHLSAPSSGPCALHSPNVPQQPPAPLPCPAMPSCAQPAPSLCPLAGAWPQQTAPAWATAPPPDGQHADHQAKQMAPSGCVAECLGYPAPEFTAANCNATRPLSVCGFIYSPLCDAKVSSAPPAPPCARPSEPLTAQLLAGAHAPRARTQQYNNRAKRMGWRMGSRGAGCRE